MSFVSIRQVHQAIVARLEVPASVIDAFELAKLPETFTVLGIRAATFGILGRESFLDSLRYRFAKSEAAMQLDQVLNNAAHFGRQLYWMDGRETGKVKVNPYAANDVLPALVDLGKHFERCRKAHFEGNDILDQKLYSLWDNLDPKRLDEIGFIAEQIIPILHEAGILHSFAELQTDDISSPSQHANGSKSPNSPGAAEEQTVHAEPTPPPLPAETAHVRVHLMEGNNALTMDELISRIVADVRNQTRWTSGNRGNLARFVEAVWNLLVDAALQGDERPSFLIGYEKIANVVRYRSTSGWAEMSPEKLRGRLRSKFKEVLEAIK